MPRRPHSGGRFRILALDCEFVEGPRRRPLVAEVALVNYDGGVVYHAYVQPSMEVHDYRTNISGIRPEQLTEAAGARSFAQVRRRVAQLLEGAILVGHAVDNDLRALGLYHPRASTRNTAYHPFFQTLNPRGQLQPQRLGHLYTTYVGTNWRQEGAHSAIEDARAAMRLYRSHEAEWNTPVVHEGPLLVRYAQ